MTAAMKGASGSDRGGNWDAMFMGSGASKGYAHKSSYPGYCNFQGQDRKFAVNEPKGVVGERQRMTSPRAVYKSGQFDGK